MLPPGFPGLAPLVLWIENASSGSCPLDALLGLTVRYGLRLSVVPPPSGRVPPTVTASIARSLGGRKGGWTLDGADRLYVMKLQLTSREARVVTDVLVTVQAYTLEECEEQFNWTDRDIEAFTTAYAKLYHENERP